MRKNERNIFFFDRNLNQDLPLRGGAKCTILLGRQFLSASLQPTLVQFGQMQFCIRRLADSNNIIQTFPRKIRKYRVRFNEGRAVSSVFMQLFGYERFRCRMDTQWMKDLQYSCAYRVLRTATVRSVIFIDSLFVIVNVTTDFAPKQH